MYAVIKTGGKQHKVKAGRRDRGREARARRRDDDVPAASWSWTTTARRTWAGGGQGHRHGQAVGREEGRQGQGLQVPAEDRLREEGRAPPDAHHARDRGVEARAAPKRAPRPRRPSRAKRRGGRTSRPTRQPSSVDRDWAPGLVAWRSYGTQEGRRLVPERPRLQRQAPRREGLRRTGRPRRLHHRAPARHPDPSRRRRGQGQRRHAVRPRARARGVPPSPAGASSPRSTRSGDVRPSAARSGSRSSLGPTQVWSSCLRLVPSWVR